MFWNIHLYEKFRPQPAGSSKGKVTFEHLASVFKSLPWVFNNLLSDPSVTWDDNQFQNVTKVHIFRSAMTARLKCRQCNQCKQSKHFWEDYVAVLSPSLLVFVLLYIVAYVGVTVELVCGFRRLARKLRSLLPFNVLRIRSSNVQRERNRLVWKS